MKVLIFPGVRQDYKLLAGASDCVTTDMPNILTAQRNASSLLQCMFSALFFFPGPPCCASEATFILSVSQIAVLMRDFFIFFVGLNKMNTACVQTGKHSRLPINGALLTFVTMVTSSAGRQW